MHHNDIEGSGQSLMDTGVSFSTNSPFSKLVLSVKLLHPHVAFIFGVTATMSNSILALRSTMTITYIMTVQFPLLFWPSSQWLHKLSVSFCFKGENSSSVAALLLLPDGAKLPKRTSLSPETIKTGYKILAGDTMKLFPPILLLASFWW